MYENAKRFQRLVTEDPELRAKIQDAASTFTGKQDGRPDGVRRDHRPHRP